MRPSRATTETPSISFLVMFMVTMTTSGHYYTLVEGEELRKGKERWRDQVAATEDGNGLLLGGAEVRTRSEILEPLKMEASDRGRVAGTDRQRRRKAIRAVAASVRKEAL
jgi:hypothetical protein